MTDASPARRPLDEAASKALLARYGVPCVAEAVAASPEEAAAVAEALGFPAVVKGLGARLSHKTERGLVAVGLPHSEAVRGAAEAMVGPGGDDLEGWLVQPLVTGRREFLVGLARDPKFGPVVALGLGGVLAEGLRDVVFRVAPFGEAEALTMLDELRSAALLGPFRGEAAVDRAALAAILAGVSRLAQEDPRVAEVDLNPVIVRPDGSPVAVDALVVLGEAADPVPPAPVAPLALARLFHPRSVAFVGASAKFGKWGHSLFTNLVAGGFQGAVHLVNPRGGTIAGRPVFPTVADLPDGVDLAIVSVPAREVPALLPQLAARGVRSAVVVSSGFREAGDGALEEALVAAARAAGVTVVGPNTMGIINPHARVYCTGAHVRPFPGTTTLVSQSGNMGVQLLAFAEAQGLGIRAFCGTGNEAVTSLEDFLEALEGDDETRVVVLYLEGVKDGRRFFEAARRLGRRKPVVALKGGRTRDGQRAAASHTGALAADHAVFEAACRQAGVLLVGQPTELLDVPAALSALPLPRGPRVAIMTWGGGWGVVAADLCAESGLAVPPLSPELAARLDRLLPPYWSRTNPVDLVGEHDLRLPGRVLEELLAWDGADAVIHLGMLGRRASVEGLLASVRHADPAADPAFLAAVDRASAAYEESFLAESLCLMARYGKPVVGVSLLPDGRGRTLLEAPGLPGRALVFPTPERATRVLSHLWAYRRFRARAG